MNIMRDKDGVLIIPKKENLGEEVYYHIMTEDGFEKMKRYGKGLMGSNKKNRKYSTWCEEGMLYCSNVPSVNIWNGISYMEIMKTKWDVFGRDGQDFIVVGFKQSTLDDLGVSVKPNTNCPLEITNIFEREIYLGNKIIPNEELFYCGKYKTDGDSWETNDRWKLVEMKMDILKEEGTTSNYPKDINKLSINDVILGDVKYSERYEKTMKKLFPTKKKKLKYIKSKQLSLRINDWESSVLNMNSHLK